MSDRQIKLYIRVCYANIVPISCMGAESTNTEHNLRIICETLNRFNYPTLQLIASSIFYNYDIL